VSDALRAVAGVGCSLEGHGPVGARDQLVACKRHGGGEERTRERRVRFDTTKRLTRASEAIGDGRDRAAALDHCRGARHEDGSGVAPPGSLEARDRLDDVLAGRSHTQLVDERLRVRVRASVGGDDERQ
jgi:hypothetical protein